MVTFEEDDDPTMGFGEDEDDEDENMEDADDGNDDADIDAEGDDGDGDDNDDENDNDDNDDDDDQDEAESPSQSRRQSRVSNGADKPMVTLTSPSPRPSSSRIAGVPYFVPPVRSEALTALTYDIAPTMAAPQGTSINAVAATPDMRWVFSGGHDGYVRMYNWVDTANGKVPLTVAQKHPFVDSVMKAGSMTTYWENGDSSIRTPPAQSADEPKDLSPVYSLAVQHEALWLLSGCESGNINLQTCRHQAGARIATLREHTSAVSVLNLANDETRLLSGSWDKRILDWDLNSGQVRRTFGGSGAQISAIEMRPQSSAQVPRVTDDQNQSGTFSSNNAAKPTTNGSLSNGVHAPSRKESRTDDNVDAMGSSGGSLFGDDDHDNSLFGDDNDGTNGGNAFGDDEDEFSKAIASGLQQNADDEEPPPNNDGSKNATTNGVSLDNDTSMIDLSLGGPVQSPKLMTTAEESGTNPDHGLTNGTSDHTATGDDPVSPRTLPQAESLQPPTQASTTNDDATPQSESIFLDAAIDGTLRIWDRRISTPIARILPQRGTPPWCMGACWSPDGNAFYAGRRNGTVDEYSVHKGFRMAEPERTFRFPTGSGVVSAVRAMPNGRHLVW